MSGTEKRLKKARRTRSQIAKVFAALDNDRIGARELLESPPACLGRIRVYDVLRRLPHLERKGAEHVLSKAKVWPLRTMSSLTEAERRAILAQLPPRVRR